MYKIINTTQKKEVLSAIARIKAAAKTEAEAAKDYLYSHTPIAVLGEEAISVVRPLLRDKCVSDVVWREPFDTDGKTSAKQIPVLYCAYYYNARDKEQGFSSDWRIGTVILYRGRYLDFHRMYKAKTATFSLFNPKVYGAELNEYIPSQWTEENPVPNMVGTLTDKKLDAWVDWLESRLNAYYEEKARRDLEVGDFLERISEQIKKGVDFHSENIDKKQGSIVKNGLEFSWRIDKGIVSTKIEVHYTTGWKDGKDKLTCFEEMCRGEYKPIK
jgi:hypothetical protein